jgi:hypothetical protein
VLDVSGPVAPDIESKQPNNRSGLPHVMGAAAVAHMRSQAGGRATNAITDELTLARPTAPRPSLADFPESNGIYLKSVKINET